MLPRYNCVYALLVLSSMEANSAFTMPSPPAYALRSPCTTTELKAKLDPSFDLSKIEIDKKTPEEELFFEHTRALCVERNLPLDNIKNARDLSSPCNSPILPGRLYRMGRLSDASDNDINMLLDSIQVKTIVDLRSPTELKDDETLLREQVFGNFTNIMWTERSNSKEGCLREIPYGEPIIQTRGQRMFSPRAVFDDGVEDCDACDEYTVPANERPRVRNRKERYFVSLMNEFKYVRGTLGKVRKRDIATTIMKSPGALVSRRVRANVKKPFLDRINDGGLPMLNELLLRYGGPGINYVLELCADRSRHPVVFHCTAGKDRTGMITCLILSLLGVDDQDIVEDYSLSANVYAEMNDHKAMVGALSQRSLDPKKFLVAPPQVMVDTLASIRREYGSIEDYLTWIGFGPEKQEQLKKALLE